MTKKIYGFAGRKRSGKGVLCNVIKENDKNVVILTIANYLKQMCCDILGIDLTLLNERKDNGYKYNIKPTNKWYDIIHNRTQIPIDTIINDSSLVKHSISHHPHTEAGSSNIGREAGFGMCLLPS